MAFFNVRFAGRLPTLLVAVTVVGLTAVWCVHAFSLWNGLQPQPQVIRVEAAETFQYDLATITEGELFSDIPVQKATQEVAAPSTNTAQYKLQAVFASRSSDRGSRAIIELPGESPRPFKVGSQLANGIAIERIEADRVIINNKGRLEALGFPSPAHSQRLEGQNMKQAQNSMESTAESQQVASVDTDSEFSSMMNVASTDEKVNLVRRRLEQLRNQSRQR